MEVLYILVPLALALAGLGIFGFIWAVRTGEFDDLESPAHIMMLDDLDSEVDSERDTSGYPPLKF
jgi:cbb3-type cytochrome oxidase maturation protein